MPDGNLSRTAGLGVAPQKRSGRGQHKGLLTFSTSVCPICFGVNRLFKSRLLVDRQAAKEAIDQTEAGKKAAVVER